MNLQKDYLLPYGAHVSYQGLLLLAPLVHPVQSVDVVSVIDQLDIPQAVQVVQIASDYLTTISGCVTLALGKNCKCILSSQCNCKLFQILFSDFAKSVAVQHVPEVILIFSRKDTMPTTELQLGLFGLACHSL